MCLRGFELIRQFAHQKELLPQRETAHAAGYDLKVAETVTIAPGKIVLVPTGVNVKAYMQDIHMFPVSLLNKKEEVTLC